jgi:hypothetical protein
MADKLQTNLGLIRNLIQRAPDGTVLDLEAALGGGMGDGALAQVRAMVDEEVCDRQARDQILGPLKPLFGPRADGLAQLTFPPFAFARLWRAAKELAPEEAAAAALARPDEGPPAEWDALCGLAGRALRERSHPEFAALAQSLDGGEAGCADQLAGCLEIIHIARMALLRLPEWLQRMTDDRAATARLAYKDAVSIVEDGGPRLFEIIYANLAEPWVVLRLICAIMLRPGDNYVSSSELAVFGVRLMDDIDARLEKLRMFDVEGGAEAAAAIGCDIRLISAIAGEFETSLNLGREGPWGHRLNKQKAQLAKAVEALLKKADSTLALALPLGPVRIGGRTVRTAPKLDTGPDPRAMRRARALVSLVEEVRGAAQAGGFNSLRNKVCEELEHRLNAYVEDLLHSIHDVDGDQDEIANARLYMDEIADLMGRLRDERAAQIVRRRAAAA